MNDDVAGSVAFVLVALILFSLGFWVLTGHLWVLDLMKGLMQ